ncbi:MAG: helix-turn-helix domain-containing protein [Planctomycetes bacterium]|nr:helix-turn-helix domain-containing protein [Planctomycetota bacterium]
MAGKLIEIAEAAKLLGVTTDELTEMRQRGEIHGYRDGASWKFKPEEIDRVKSERADGDGSDSSEYDQAFNDLMPKGGGDEESASEMDSVSILVSEESLGKSPETSSSTIIGKKNPESDSPSESDIVMRGEGGSGGSPNDMSDVLSGQEMELKKPGSGTGDMEVESSGDGLDLDSQELDLQDSESALSLDDSDELVLGGSGSKGSGKGSDVSLDPAGSGINLTNPSDSGLSLSEEPLQLAGSSVESLELPEDDDVISQFDSLSDSDQGTQLKADDEFLLSAMEDLGSDESSDSGSQVIALEDSEAFDENAATALAPQMPQAQPGPMLAQEQPDLMGGALAGMAPGMAGVTATLNVPSPYAAMPSVEAPYRFWEVGLLMLPMLSLLLAGALMFDVLRNMWAFDQPHGMSTAIMDSVISIFFRN